MDFDRGSDSGRSDDRPLYGEETGGPPPRGPVGSIGVEFDYRDPVVTFIPTVLSVLSRPVAFFRGIARRGDFVSPLVFAVICIVIYAVLAGIISFLVAAGTQDFGAALGGVIGGVIGGAIGGIVGLFVGAGIYHLLVLLFVRPANAGFEATFRVVAYPSALLLVTWLATIPILGIFIALAALVYNVILNIVGIREVHSTTTGRAALVVLIPIAVLFILALIIGVLVAALLVGASQQQI